MDTDAGKNLLGAFHQPRAVFIDCAFLSTLPDDQLKSGLAEVIKYGAIESPELLDEIEAAVSDRGLTEPAFLEKIVSASCRIKKGLVEIDEMDRGVRRVLNFGHTVGHAVEAASGYALTHGQSVAVGMVAAAGLSERLHYLPASDRERIGAVIRATGLSDRIPPGIATDEIISRLAKDKKKEGGEGPFRPPQEAGGPLREWGDPGRGPAGDPGGDEGMNENGLEGLREKIEETDREIVRLLDERAAVSAEIGRVKHGLGLPVYDPARESLVFAQLEGMSGGDLPEGALKAIYREIISASRAVQAPTRVVFLGPAASFSHQAVLAHFGSEIEIAPKATIHEVFDELEREKVSWGVVPVENSTEGSVKATLDRLITTPLIIRAEIFLRVRQCLLSRAASLEAVRKVYSHPQGLAQSQKWLRANLPGRSLVEVESTAGARREGPGGRRGGRRREQSCRRNLRSEPPFRGDRRQPRKHDALLRPGIQSGEKTPARSPGGTKPRSSSGPPTPRGPSTGHWNLSHERGST